MMVAQAIEQIKHVPFERSSAVQPSGFGFGVVLRGMGDIGPPSSACVLYFLPEHELPSLAPMFARPMKCVPCHSMIRECSCIGPLSVRGKGPGGGRLASRRLMFCWSFRTCTPRDSKFFYSDATVICFPPVYVSCARLCVKYVGSRAALHEQRLQSKEEALVIGSACRCGC